MPASSQIRIDVLTSMRFIAAIYVLLFHSGGPTLTVSGRLPSFAIHFFANGYLGVTFFFVLSGFILTYVYSGKINSTADVINYGWARFSRIYPVYLLALLFTLPFFTDWQSWAGVPQFVLLQSWSPLAMFTDHVMANANGPAWTLSVELLFYLLFPGLLWALSHLSTRSVVVATVLIAGLILGLRTSGISDIRHVLFEAMGYVPVPLLRLPEFCFGMCIGSLFVRGAMPRSPLALLGLTACLAVVLLSSQSLWVAPATTLLVGGIIGLAPASLGTGLAANIFNSRLMTLLGAASFSLYIIQTPVHFWMQWMASGPYAILGRLFYLPVMLVLSVVVFLCFEEVVRRALRQFPSRPLAAT